MSVSFMVDAVDTGKFVVVDDCGEAPFIGVRYGSRADADRALVAHGETCKECDFYARVEAEWDRDPAFTVTLNQTDARVMLARLDITEPVDGDLAGAMDADDFAGRVLVALATLGDDSGVRATVRDEPGRARFVDAGVPAGHVGETLRRLDWMAGEARRLGRHVVWY